MKDIFEYQTNYYKIHLRTKVTNKKTHIQSDNHVCIDKQKKLKKAKLAIELRFQLIEAF